MALFPTIEKAPQNYYAKSTTQYFSIDVQRIQADNPQKRKYKLSSNMICFNHNKSKGGKKKNPCMFLLYSHNTLKYLTFDTKCACFPHIKQFLNCSWCPTK